MTDAEFMECMEDPLWRLQNLYSIKTEDEGRKIPFVPRPEQLEVLTALIETPEEPQYIIKSRRLGMSTAIGLAMTDCAGWNDGFQGSLVDQTQSDAERKMAEIMRFGLLSLEPELLERFEFPKKNDGELQVKVAGASAETISRIFAGKNARGGTNNFLWLSELGPIAANDPRRSREIRTGALPSARRGRRIVETTWYGGKGGDLWELIKPILENNPNARGKVRFYPWHGDPACISATGLVDAELEQYFRELTEKLGKRFSPEQKKWYAFAKLEQGIFVKREYPSTLDEAMTAPVEGAIYGQEVMRARAEGRIKFYPVDGSALVHTFWDEGSPLNTVVWYVQFVGHEIRIVDCDCCPQTDDDHEKAKWNFTTVQRVAHIKGKPFGNILGNHYLTHAAAQTPASGKSFSTDLTESGLPNVKIVPRTVDVWRGINQLRQLFPRMVFRTPASDTGLAGVECYHTHPTTGEPVHDWSSHPSDGLRTMAEALWHGMIEGGSSVAVHSRQNLSARSITVRTGFRGNEKPTKSRVIKVLR